ncbi:linear gramicidin synthase subunit C-like [Athalia rosae]|uniref:linear gramicidin synthase subunit C-like n=1 Tax=Athalia rosae TaxID=37344 RepID=UPI0020345F98|nr:linear gramicidin synthase subunit C-like [Athalia rosae]
MAEPEFRIDGDILKGRVISYPNRYNGIGEFILESVKKNPDMIGQINVATGESQTQGEIFDRSVRCALWLKSQGIVPGDVVAICSDHHLDVHNACYGMIYIGAIFYPLDARMNTNEFRHVLDLTKPRIAFVSAEVALTLAEAAKEVIPDLKLVVFGKVRGCLEFEKVIAEANVEDVRSFEYTPIESIDTTLAIMCSSGTTGLPKGVALSHRSILNQLYNMEYNGLTHVQCIVFSPICWISGASFMILNLASNRTRIMTPPFEPYSACSLIEKYKPMFLLLASSMVNRLVKSDALQKYDLSSLKRVVYGGAILPQQSARAFSKLVPGALLSSCYGLTEVGGAFSIQGVNPKHGSAGNIVRNSQLKIIDPETGKTLGVNQKGELLLKSGSMMIGYYKNPKATAETIDEEGWLHSGDLGYFDEDGEIFVIERLKEVMKYRGQHISAIEIETVILSHPGVKEVAVVSIPHPTEDEHPIAFVVKNENPSNGSIEVTETELDDLVASNLSDAYRLRAGIHFLEGLPKAPSDKVQRKKLRDLAKTVAKVRYESMTKESDVEFKIEDNILKGKVIKSPNRYNKGVGEFIVESLKKNLDMIGQIDVVTGISQTRREIVDRSVRCALWMKSQGIVPGDVVAVCSDHHLDSHNACYGMIYIGAIFNPLDTRLNANEFQHLLELIKPKMVFANVDVALTLSEAAKEVVPDLKIITFGKVRGYLEFEKVIAEADIEDVRSFRYTPIESMDSTLAIMCSSGTTGSPKGVALSHRSILNQLHIMDKYGLTHVQIVVFSSICWISGAVFMILNLASNKTKIMNPPVEPHAACSLIEKYKPRYLILATSMVNKLLKSGALQDYDLSSLKCVVCGGNILAPQLAEAFSKLVPGAKLSSNYGLSEIGGPISIQGVNRKPGSAGQIVHNSQLKIIDPETGKTLGVNQKGEILIKSGSMMIGYYKNPKATAETIDEEGWLHSGDLGYFDEDGEIFVIDRLKEVMKSRGRHISAIEIETVMLSHAGVKEAAVVSVPHQIDEEHLIAFVVRNENSSDNTKKVTETELDDLVVSKLSDAYRLRAGIYFVDELPKGPSDKVQRKKLRDLAKTVAKVRYE